MCVGDRWRGARGGNVVSGGCASGVSARQQQLQRVSHAMDAQQHSHGRWDEHCGQRSGGRTKRRGGESRDAAVMPPPAAACTGVRTPPCAPGHRCRLQCRQQQQEDWVGRHGAGSPRAGPASHLRRRALAGAGARVHACGGSMGTAATRWQGAGARMRHEGRAKPSPSPLFIPPVRPAKWLK